MQRLPAQRTYLSISFGWQFLMSLAWTVTPVYYLTVVGMNPFQLVIAGTVMEVTFFLLEVPIGVLADAVSRRLSVIAGMATFGLSFLVQGLIPEFAAVMVGSVLFGVAWSFVDGALEAWAADEIRDAEIGAVYLRGTQFGNFATIVGALLSVALASIFLHLPIVAAGGIFLVVAVLLSVAMPEEHFPISGIKERGSVVALLRTSKKLIRSSPILMLILGISLFYGLSSEGIDRLWEAHLITDLTLPRLGVFEPIVWFGLIRAGSRVLSIVSTEIVRRKLDTTRHDLMVRWLIVIDVLRVGSVAGFALAGNLTMAIIAFWTGAALRAVLPPIYDAWVVQMVEPRVRATVLSANGMVNSLGEIAAGPALGAVALLASIRAALVGSAALLIPAIGLLFGAERSKKPKPESVSPGKP